MADIDEKVVWFQGQLESQEDKLAALATAETLASAANHGTSVLGAAAAE